MLTLSTSGEATTIQTVPPVPPARSQMPVSELEMLLDQALTEPIGLLLSCSDPERFRARLYTERRKSGRFSCLQFRISPFPDGQLVICKADPKGWSDDPEE